MAINLLLSSLYYKKELNSLVNDETVTVIFSY